MDDEGKIETIINDGLFYYKVGNENHITFFDNAYGRKLKKMWKQLNEPIKAKKNKRGEKENEMPDN